MRLILDENLDQNSDIVPDVIIETNTSSDNVLIDVAKTINEK